MAKRGYKYVKPLAEATGLVYGTLRNAVTGRNPHPLHLADIYVLAEVLRTDGETVEDVVRDILATSTEGVPDEPPRQPQGPKGPARRQDNEDDDDKKRTGPRRASAGTAA